MPTMMEVVVSATMTKNVAKMAGATPADSTKPAGQEPPRPAILQL